MGVRIIVERVPANKTGPDIVDSLLSSDFQAMYRGAKDINENSTNRFIVSGSSPLTTYMEPGKIAQVTDLQKGQYNGMLLTYSANISMGSNGEHSAVTAVSLEREA